MKRFRVIFMGTPDFAVPCLARLVEISDVVAVVTPVSFSPRIIAHCIGAAPR